MGKAAAIYQKSRTLLSKLRRDLRNRGLSTEDRTSRVRSVIPEIGKLVGMIAPLYLKADVSDETMRGTLIPGEREAREDLRKAERAYYEDAVDLLDRVTNYLHTVAEILDGTIGRTAQMSDLHHKVIRLAHQKPELRPILLPLLGVRVARTNRIAAADGEWGDRDRSAPRTPWGPAQVMYQIEPGVRWFITASHGGLQVSPGVAARKLSGAARKLAAKELGSLWFEEDVLFNIAFYENPEWARILKQKAGGSAASPSVMSIERWYPEYFQMVESGEAPPKPPKVGMRFELHKATNFGSVVGIVPVGAKGKIEKVTPGYLTCTTDKSGDLLLRFPRSYWEEGHLTPL